MDVFINLNKTKSFRSLHQRLDSRQCLNLSLGINQISVLPDGIFNYPSITSVYIYLYGNKHKATPSFAVFQFHSADIVYIYLGGNRIASITCQSQINFPQATDVVISFGLDKITTVPSCAFNFPSTTSVNLYSSNNLITTIFLNFPFYLNFQYYFSIRSLFELGQQ